MATIKKRGESYLIRAYYGYDTNGKQIEKSMTWKPDPGMTQRQIEKEVQRQALLFEEKIKNGFAIDGSIKFSEYSQKFMRVNESQLAPKTYERYSDLLVRINQAIGHIRLDKLQPMHLQEFYKNLAENGVKYIEQKATTKDLSDLLDKKGISKCALAKNANVSKPTVIAACNGNKILLSKAEAISKALKMDIKKVFTVHDIKQGLSEQTIKHHHRLISSILSQATREQIISRNVASSVYMKAPKVTKKEPAYLDDVQAVEVAELLMQEEVRVKTSILLLIYSGMRLGELCGLEWKDIDFDNNIIHVRRSSQYVAEKGIITKEPKNESSQRAVKLPTEMFKTLGEYKKWYTEQRLMNGDRWVNSDRLFIKCDGAPIYPNTIGGWLKAFRNKNCLPKFTPHALRHTNITLQIAAGVPIRTVSARAGHSQTSTTTNIYAHAIKAADESAAAALSDMLKPRKNKAN